MPMYWKQNEGELLEEDFDMDMEDEDCVTQQPQIWRNEEWMEDFEVKIILISKLQMMKQLLSDNYIREEFGIQKF